MPAPTYSQAYAANALRDLVRDLLLSIISSQNADGSAFSVSASGGTDPQTYAQLLQVVPNETDLVRRLLCSWLSGQNPDGSAFDLPLTGLAPSGAAGGFLGGSYPNPTTAAGNSLIKNADVDAAAGIVKSKLAALGIVDADVAVGAAIAKAKLAALNVGQADMATGFRALADSASAPASPVAGDLWFDTTNNLLKVRDSGNANWVTITPQGATIATSETTTSAIYVDLTTVGPSVTLLTGTSALVTIGCRTSNSNALATSFMAVAVSGATTLAAADGNGCSNIGGNKLAISGTFRPTGLTRAVWRSRLVAGDG
jgi:hypothetical protein